MKREALAAGSLMLAVLAGAAAISAATDTPAGTTIYGCENVRHGLVRVIPAAGGCKRNERALQWNERGPQGEAGPAGPKGDPGPAGPQGDASVASIGSLAGSACTTFDGASGKVAVDVTATDLITLTCEATTAPPAGPSTLVLNEIDYDQPGADTGGFVEVKNIGSSAASLDGIAVVLVNGDDGAEYARKALTGTLAPGAYVTVDVDAQNGPDGVALFDTAAAKLLDALAYEGATASATIGGGTYPLVEGTILPATVADSNTEDGSLIRSPDGKDTNDAAADWVFSTTKTPGAANVFTP
jgi:hypothetical protein